MARTHRTIPLLSIHDIQRFWEKVRRGGEDDCWVWMACQISAGYGQFGMGRRTYLAPRISYQIAHGVCPTDKCVLHHCDNPPCVNPAHLFLGTDADNCRDRIAKGRTVQYRGTMMGTTKLSESVVAEIRTRYAAGNVSWRQLAAEYGVSHTTIGSAIRGVWWQHVA